MVCFLYNKEGHEDHRCDECEFTLTPVENYPCAGCIDMRDTANNCSFRRMM